MNIQDFYDGIRILIKYFDNPKGFHINTEHDHFYVNATDRPLTDYDLARLRELDWFQSEARIGEAYDSSEGWSCFV